MHKQTHFTVLITGASRGIGLGYVQHYAALGHRVIATVRDVTQAAALHQLAATHANISIFALEVADPDAIQALAKQLSTETIDILISNAGMYPKSDVTQASMTDWLAAFKVNTLSTYYLAQAFTPHLTRATTPKLIAMTSKMGSMTDNSSGGSYIYRSSKAALNMVVKSLAIDLAEDQIIVAALHPGWVRTAMGGPDGLIDVTTSVQGLTQVISTLRFEDSGRFIDYTGKSIAW